MADGKGRMDCNPSTKKTTLANHVSEGTHALVRTKNFRPQNHASEGAQRPMRPTHQGEAEGVARPLRPRVQGRSTLAERRPDALEGGV
jgi:hypothetical protein